uniref:Uncharacterized protein n=1 Tax=Suricata suricatta TaxID=37032 RepID=A0A673UIJ1_SURSU
IILFNLESGVSFPFANTHLLFFFFLDNSNVILSGNLHCHFKSIAQIFARHFMEGDTEAKKLSCRPIAR